MSTTLDDLKVMFRVLEPDSHDDMGPAYRPATVPDVIEVFKTLGAETVEFENDGDWHYLSEKPGRYLVYRLQEK